VRGLVLIAAGGALGALARYGATGLAVRLLGAGFPYGTLAVNLLGCLAIGVVFYLWQDRAALSDAARQFVAIGFLGSFTTFSAFGAETFALWRNGSVGTAALYVAASVALGLAAVWLGHALAALVWRG
jgi:CrcB protein